MTTAIDTNVVDALWDKDSTLSFAAQTALDAAFNRGSLVVAVPVFAELIAAQHCGQVCVNSSLNIKGGGNHNPAGRLEPDAGRRE
jgi:hypothetical protein